MDGAIQQDQEGYLVQAPCFVNERLTLGWVAGSTQTVVMAADQRLDAIAVVSIGSSR